MEPVLLLPVKAEEASDTVLSLRSGLQTLTWVLHRLQRW